MTKKEARKRIEKLKEAIDYHRYLYHVLDRQEISSDALDSLKRELVRLEREFPEFASPDSPTQRVAGRPLEKFKKARHASPMLSMEDVFSEKELAEWRSYLRRLEPSARLSYFCELKIDGFAVSLVYKNGILARGATRGDGRVGEDVTQNLKTIESIPLKLAGRGPAAEAALKKPRLEVRGEVYMEKKDFEEINRRRRGRGLGPYSNPRNVAAGSIRQLNPKTAASRPLKFLAYGVASDIGQKTHSQEHAVLAALGFKVDEGRECGTLGEVARFWRRAEKEREKLPFQIDGIVVSVNDSALFRKLGAAGKSPRGARALKFSPKEAVTVVKGITVKVGRTGAVTPIAVLEPVEIGGAVISRATLHNEGEIGRIGAKIGDTVVVQRAGDVIPAVAKVVKEMRTGKEREFRFPRRCPACGAALSKKKEEAVWRCPAPECPAKNRRRLCHFASKKAFNIEGLGPKTINRLADRGLVSSPADFFRLKKEDVLLLDGFREKAAENLLRSIRKSGKGPLETLLYALGIRHVGEQAAFNLARWFGGLGKVGGASKEELEKVPDIGPQAAESVRGWFRKAENRKLVKELLESGIEIAEPRKTGARLEGKTFVFTGGLEAMARGEAERLVRALGGRALKSVSGRVDFLVAGKKPGRKKIGKAGEIGVKTIGEKEFLNMLKAKKQF